MSALSPIDDARFCRARHLPEVELVTVTYRDRAFPEHRHDSLVIGAITAGAETLTVSGASHAARRGSILRLCPGETHANATIGSEILQYSVLYIPESALEEYCDVSAGAGRRFATPVLQDAALYDAVRIAHDTLSCRTIGKADQISALSALARKICIADVASAESTDEAPATVMVARDFIDAHLADSFGLAALCSLTGLTRFHLIRAFKKVVGLSPIAYRNHQRINAARRLLVEGASSAHVAQELGYADQSHFTRQFQRIVGTSPRRYARSISGAPGA